MVGWKVSMCMAVWGSVWAPPVWVKMVWMKTRGSASNPPT